MTVIMRFHYIAVGSADLFFPERFYPFCSDTLLLSYHHECLSLSLLPVGGAAAGVQLPLLEPILLSSLPTSLKEGRGGSHDISLGRIPLCSLG